MRYVNYCFALLGVLLAFACGGGINPNAQPANVSQAKPIAEPAKPIPDYPAVLTVKNMEVAPVSVQVAQVPLTILGDDGRSEESHLIFTVKLTNTSETKRVEFRGWPELHSLTGANCTCRDEHDNAYKVINFGIGSRPTGDAAGDTIDPGKSVNAVVVFEKPIDAAKVLTIRLEGSAVGAPGQKLEWKIRRDQW